MRTLIAVAAIFLSTSAYAVDYRWTFGFGQGTTESIIQNDLGSNVNIYCPSGRPDAYAGISIQTKRINVAAKEQLDVQIVVDGKSFPLLLDYNTFEAAGRAGKALLLELSNALASSKARYFTVEYPRYRTSETFSLLDARKSLGFGKKSNLVPCMN